MDITFGVGVLIGACLVSPFLTAMTRRARRWWEGRSRLRAADARLLERRLGKGR